MRPWTETGRSESVKTVHTPLGPKLGYPIEFFDAFVRVLQSGRYDDGSPVLLGNWELYCKYDSSRIILELPCAQCGERRSISPRQVCKLSVSSSLFSCVMVGMGCNGVLGAETSGGPLATIGEVTKPEGHEYEVGKMTSWMRWGETGEETHGEVPRQSSIGEVQLPFDPSRARSMNQTPAASHSSVVLPDQFIVGRPASVLTAPGPTVGQVEEFEQLRRMNDWGVCVSRLLKWAKSD